MSSSPKTLIYSHVGGIDVKLDLYAPDANGSAPILIWFHGGGLYCGSRDDDLFPFSLCDAALKRKWIFITADYRLLLPFNGHDILADIRALSSFLSSDAFRNSLPSGLVPSNSIFTAGASAGGYMALQYALQASLKPKAVLNMFGLSDLLDDHYVHPHPDGVPFFGGLNKSFDLDKLLHPPPSSGSPMRAPTYECADGRHMTMIYVIQEGVIPDYLTNRPGLSKTLGALPTKDARAHALDDEIRPLFPLLFVRELPPVVSVHGMADTAVPLAHSETLKALLDEAGIKNELIPVPDAEHGLLSKDNFGVEAPAAEDAVGKAVEFLASCL
ncbi:alpha/beta-hydrolase [Punctularia strigosozonata HHB-11173 SS5]|uniref:Alpha/beta-hydrolase n=1 Tax=Punctularia strigosozonata (strain HHB-11173) TaxID=741275 RepID=R7S4T7_PUNST|nr:alpha/beta-hydrolase [Punctularia strigosozonata HHB-11173 SS5]EIN04832.1 alpha/beta-hydrolase [Punctularia strigosozonata HHB-11173 SS5]